ncbi:acyl-CoA desaturase [Micromonospora sp. NPDC049580]|uniref:fatty acid desaturase family protein n=1 Tax=Micromonospora sp. NPDC049580 TaxID=3154832 RepID=UPI0034340C99
MAKGRGHFARQPLYYAIRSALNALGITSCAMVLVTVKAPWVQLSVAVPLAFMFGQVALVGHDAGHRQLARSPGWTRVWGYLHLNLGVGLSFGWWVKRHTRHHAHPNDPARDPDAMNAFIMYSEGQVNGRGRVRRMVGRYQAYLFLPALFLLPGVVLHVTHVGQLVRHRLRLWVIELILIFGHFTIMWWAVAAVMPLGRAVAFMAIHRALMGAYLAGVIAPNHKGMPMLNGWMSDDFLLRQVMTSRNVRGGLVTEIVYGGLNYQIEHHLFPSMPVPGLRRVRPLVKDYCMQWGIPYTEVGIFESYRRVLTGLHEIGRDRVGRGRR